MSILPEADHTYYDRLIKDHPVTIYNGERFTIQFYHLSSQSCWKNMYNKTTKIDKDMFLKLVQSYSNSIEDIASNNSNVPLINCFSRLYMNLL